MTKQWTAKWPYIVSAVFQIVKIMVKKVTFIGFTVADRPPPGSAPVCSGAGTSVGRGGGSKKLRAMETYEKQKKCYQLCLLLFNNNVDLKKNKRNYRKFV